MILCARNAESLELFDEAGTLVAVVPFGDRHPERCAAKDAAISAAKRIHVLLELGAED